jgi:hypothetical protein
MDVPHNIKINPLLMKFWILEWHGITIIMPYFKFSFIQIKTIVIFYQGDFVAISFNFNMEYFWNVESLAAVII